MDFDTWIRKYVGPEPELVRCFFSLADMRYAYESTKASQQHVDNGAVCLTCGIGCAGHTTPPQQRDSGLVDFAEVASELKDIASRLDAASYSLNDGYLSDIAKEIEAQVSALTPTTKE